jgi:calcineurin-like phosphoesterase family protein
MSQIWFTSDLHFGHKNIIKYSNRPFDDVNHMNEVLISNFNSIISPNDQVIFVGDVCMGVRSETLPLLSRLNGIKFLIPGNHDDCHEMYSDNFEKWKTKRILYENYFEEILNSSYEFFGFLVSHFPYDTNEEDKNARSFGNHVAKDSGTPLICGHVHEEWKMKKSKQGTFMINVGVDVNDFKPISFDEILKIYESFKDI